MARRWTGGRRWRCGTTRRRVRRGGYGGSGPAQLALAILLAVTDEATAERFYQKFKWDVLAPIEADRWALDAGDVLNWLESAAGGTDGVVRLAVETCE